MNFSKTEPNRKKGLKQSTDDHDMSRTIDLFRKYLLTKSQVGKTNKEESEVIKSHSPRTLIPIIMPSLPSSPSPLSSKFDCNFSRPLSLLERKILLGIRCEEMQTCSSSGDDKPSKAQLTIFYDGIINVYNNVPTDKAQAIMVLAGESSLSKPAIENETPKREAKTPFHWPNLESSYKVQADISIARKTSPQHFLAKRRRRIENNSPYAAAANQEKKDENELILDNHHIPKENTTNHIISLSPFPSRLGYFSPVPATNRSCQA